MLVAVTGFGSVWRRFFTKDADDPRRVACGAYYNTTGVFMNGVVRQRPKILGYARFNGVGGFNPNRPSRMINRVFDCADQCVWNGANKLGQVRTRNRQSFSHGVRVWFLCRHSKQRMACDIGRVRLRSVQPKITRSCDKYCDQRSSPTGNSTISCGWRTRVIATRV